TPTHWFQMKRSSDTVEDGPGTRLQKIAERRGSTTSSQSLEDYVVKEEINGMEAEDPFRLAEKQAKATSLQCEVLFYKSVPRSGTNPKKGTVETVEIPSTHDRILFHSSHITLRYSHIFVVTSSLSSSENLTIDLSP